MPLYTTSLKHVMRRLARSPMFTAVTLITVAAGVGANTAIFSIVHGVLLKPLPYPDSDRLAAIWETTTMGNLKEVNACPATYFTFREEGRVFQDSGVWRSDSYSITDAGDPEQVSALEVTDGTLQAIGIQPVLGRWFTQKDDTPGTPQTVILMYGYWQRKFGGNPSVLGKRIIADGEAREIIGVMPQSFRFMNRKAEFILPLRFDRAKIFIGNFSYQAVARLKPGVTIAQANADVDRMLPLMLRKFPPAPGLDVKIFEDLHLGSSVRPLKNDVVGDIGKVLWVLMGTVGIVLFIACANVANLLLVRAEARQQELAIRAALGAGWGQIARELLLESTALGLVGGALGLGVAYSVLRLILALGASNLPRVADITINSTVMLFALAVSLVASLVFGLVPVFKYAGPRLGSALRDGGRTLSAGRERHRARNILVVVQVSLALVLLISSGLMLRTFQALNRVQPGFTHPEEILTFRLSIPDKQVPEPERVVRTFEGVMKRLSAIPGVQSVALTNSVTMDGNDNNDPIFPEDHPYSDRQIPPLRRMKFLSPGLFHAMGNPLLAGRDFTWTDIYDKRTVGIVSENLAREYWRDPAAAIGKRIRENPKGPWREIVGVVANERDNGVSQPAPTIVYWPMMMCDFWDNGTMVRRTMAFAVRSSRTGTAAFTNDVRQAVWAGSPDLPIYDLRTVKETYDKSMARTAFTLVMLAIAAGLALLLGVVGIYGVISYSVSQRTREIGIRIALGAPQRQVTNMFVRHGFMLAAIGVGCGLAAAAALTRLMSALLFEVKPIDPVTYALVPLVLAAAVLLASYLPARRATAIAPVDALRAE
jgi:putative ABC transport system permease protein